MLRIRVRFVDNLPDYKAILTKFSYVAATRIRDRMRRKLNSEAKHGRTYGYHIASAPGEAPASFTGALSASLMVEQGSTESSVFTALTESYPELLETKMNRPLWEASVDEEMPYLENILFDMMNV